MGLRIGLVVNPTAGHRRARAVGAEVARLLAADGHDVVDLSAHDAAAAGRRASKAVAEGIDVLAVTGGDGMAHLGVNACAGTGTALAIVAAGSGNDVASGLGLPVHDPAAMAALVTAGTVRSIDAVRQIAPEGHATWFVGVLCGGFDAVVNERANTWTWPRGQLRYPLAVLRELPLFRPIPYAVTIDGARRETAAMLVAIGNGTSYGGGMKVTPDAEVDDGLLDVLIVHDISIPRFLAVFPQVYSGAHVSHPAVEIVRGRTITLEASGVVAYADGERFAPLPVTVEVVPQALDVIVPAAVAPAAPGRHTHC